MYMYVRKGMARIRLAIFFFFSPCLRGCVGHCHPPVLKRFFSPPTLPPSLPIRLECEPYRLASQAGEMYCGQMRTGDSPTLPPLLRQDLMIRPNATTKENSTSKQHATWPQNWIEYRYIKLSKGRGEVCVFCLYNWKQVKVLWKKEMFSKYSWQCCKLQYSYR